MTEALLDAARLYAMCGLVTLALVAVFASPGQWQHAINMHGLQDAPPSFLAFCAIVCGIIAWPLILREMLSRRS
jgi:hypothetical protein